jgi:phosphonate transport system permease protein
MIETNVIKPPSKLKSLLNFILLFILLIASAYKTEANFPKLLSGFPEMGKLLVQMIPPDWSYFSNIWTPMLETIRMAILGSTFGAILAVPVALFAASNVTKSVVLYYCARFILNLIRTVPDLLFAAVFVAIFGIGQ